MAISVRLEQIKLKKIFDISVLKRYHYIIRHIRKKASVNSQFSYRVKCNSIISISLLNTKRQKKTTRQRMDINSCILSIVPRFFCFPHFYSRLLKCYSAPGFLCSFSSFFIFAIKRICEERDENETKNAKNRVECNPLCECF